MNLNKKPIRVLLVDDHQTMLWGLGKLIEGENPRMEVVGTASNCEEARDKAGTLMPDVILLDLDLEGRSSLDYLPAMLANGVSRALILTAERQQAILDQAVQHGARGVLHKIASAEQVLKAIEKVHQGELWIENEMLSRVLGKFMSPATKSAPDPEMARIAQLTLKERKIIDTIVRESGASNKVIAQRLFISEHTLRNHLTSIYQKLDLSNRLELYVYAVKHALDSARQEPRPGDKRRDAREPSVA
ncbi:response regulator [Noviherbaspirillum sedimenti]|uniref:DNA-binding response regulator n=1 Tax=Noviherbaspirillum sedimenti TaxID=2320865 RepID=A0A3A3G5B9_9BURK|nr:response regulator transcription factor [Noviherbaspirillum sedimenti]RJG03658.1 DNA-binding response regulator [Noviherbaspirillum sedimenti]